MSYSSSSRIAAMRQAQTAAWVEADRTADCSWSAVATVMLSETSACPVTSLATTAALRRVQPIFASATAYTVEAHRRSLCCESIQRSLVDASKIPAPYYPSSSSLAMRNCSDRTCLEACHGCHLNSSHLLATGLAYRCSIPAMAH